jgi:DNA helicase HerA-like ATPase
MVREDGTPEDLTEPAFYVLNLRSSFDAVERVKKVAALVDFILRRAKTEVNGFPTLIVIDEAQYYAPEQQTGWLSQARDSADAIYKLAAEGREFRVGLIISTQRPARVNKDVLSQANSHLVFRVANHEDLMAVRSSFEAATTQMVLDLPGFDTGVAIVGGTAIDMVAQVQVAMFDGESETLA